MGTEDNRQKFDDANDDIYQGNNELEITKIRAELEDMEQKYNNIFKDLEVANRQISQLTKNEKDVKKLEKDLKDMSTEKRELETRLKKIVAEEKLKEDENKELKKKLQLLEQQKAKEIASLKTAVQDREKYIERCNILEKKISSMEVSQGTAASGTIVTDKINTPHSRFQIDTYLRQGQYDGKIEHTLSKEKAFFKGVNSKVIAEFITRHLPDFEAESFTPAKETYIGGSVKAQAFISKSFVADTPIKGKLSLKIDETITTEALPLNCRASLYARSLGGGNKILLSNFRIALQDTSIHSFDIVSGGLNSGMYQLESILTAETPDGKRIPCTTNYENELLYVI